MPASRLLRGCSPVCFLVVLAGALVVPAGALARDPVLVLPRAWYHVTEPYRHVESRRFEAGWNRGAGAVPASGAARVPVGGVVGFAGMVAGRNVVTVETTVGGVPAVVTFTGLTSIDVEAGEQVATGDVVGPADLVHVGAYDRRRRSRYLPVAAGGRGDGAERPATERVGRGGAPRSALADGIARRLLDAIDGRPGELAVRPSAATVAAGPGAIRWRAGPADREGALEHALHRVRQMHAAVAEALATHAVAGTPPGRPGAAAAQHVGMGTPRARWCLACPESAVDEAWHSTTSGTAGIVDRGWRQRDARAEDGRRRSSHAAVAVTDVDGEAAPRDGNRDAWPASGRIHPSKPGLVASSEAGVVGRVPAGSGASGRTDVGPAAAQGNISTSVVSASAARGPGAVSGRPVEAAGMRLDRAEWTLAGLVAGAALLVAATWRRRRPDGTGSPGSVYEPLPVLLPHVRPYAYPVVRADGASVLADVALAWPDAEPGTSPGIEPQPRAPSREPEPA